MMDRLLEGLVSAQAENPNLQQPPRSDYVEALLRSSVSSHVLEVIMLRCPSPVFDLLFKMYFQGRIAKLAGHAVANFVVAKVVERASKEQVEVMIDEIPEALSGIIENSRTGVVKGLLEKAVVYNTKHAEIHHMLCDAFQTRKEDDIQYLLPCGLSLMTLALYRRNAAFSDPTIKPEFFMQGALLLQAWLRIPKCPVSESILQTPIDRLLTYTSDLMASRIIDVFLDDQENPAVAYKDRRNFLKNLIGHYQKLADDRIGSRVADRCWAAADPFLKVRLSLPSRAPSAERMLHQMLTDTALASRLSGQDRYIPQATRVHAAELSLRPLLPAQSQPPSLQARPARVARPTSKGRGRHTGRAALACTEAAAARLRSGAASTGGSSSGSCGDITACRRCCCCGRRWAGIEEG